MHTQKQMQGKRHFDWQKARLLKQRLNGGLQLIAWNARYTRSKSFEIPGRLPE